MRRELRHGVAGEAVALDKDGALFGHRHVPGDKAHLGHLLGGLEAHGLGLLKEGHLEAHDGRVRHGMLGVGVTLLVRAHGQQLSAFQVHARGHAALIDVVHDLAVADAQEGIDDALLLVAQEGGDADGVDRGGAERHQPRVLDDPLLDDADLPGQQLPEESILPALPVACGVAGDAHAAAALQRLGDDVRVVSQKGFESCGVRVRAQLHPAAPHLGGEKLVEGRLVVKEVPVRLVVHPPDDLVAQAARDLRFALRVVEAVHLGDLVVHVSGVVFQRAAQHVGQKPQAAFAALEAQHAGGFPHGLPVHAHQPFQKEG